MVSVLFRFIPFISLLLKNPSTASAAKLDAAAEVNILTIKDIKLKVKTEVTNHASAEVGMEEGTIYPEDSELYIPDNATIAISYSVAVRAIQADFVDIASVRQFLVLTTPSEPTP